MATHHLIWVLRKPLRNPGRCVAILLLCVIIAPLRLSMVASTLPLLKVILRDDWAAQLRDMATESPRLLEPVAVLAAEWVGESSAGRALFLILCGMFALALLRAALVIWHEAILAKLVHHTMRDVSSELHDALLRGAGQSRAEGAVLSHFATDLDAVRQSLRRVYGKVIREPFVLLATVVMLWTLDATLALWTGLVFPAAAGLLLALAKRLKSASRRSLQRTGDMVGQVEESLRGRRTVWSFGLEQRESQRFRTTLEGLTRDLIKLDRREALSSPLLEILGLVAGIACCVMGATRVLDGDLSAESFLTFYVVLIMVLDPLRKLADTHVRLQRGAVAAHRLEELINSAPARPPVAGNLSFPHPVGELLWQGVGVDSPEDHPLLEDVSFRIESGQVVVIAGPSGAGKSTLLDVQAGLRSYDRGSVTLGGRELRDLRPADFRRQVALVAQETFLFRGTLEENITLGQPPRQVPLDQALVISGMAERVARLPAGLETRVEDHAFSVGERQRLSLARSLYRDPAILLLDEATSALDRPMAQDILDALLAARSDRITLLVTHHLSQDLGADLVVLLERGRVLASGSPQAVEERSSLYRKLLRAP